MMGVGAKRVLGLYRSCAPRHLRGALKNLGHELGRNTIKRILADHGIAPAPERGKSMSWSTFIKAHWGAIAATDLFTVESGVPTL